MKIRCPPCSHVPGSSIGDYVAIYVGSFPPPRTKTFRRSAPTSQPNPITFRTLTFVVNLSLLFVVGTFAGNGQTFVPIFRNYFWNFLSSYSNYVYIHVRSKGDDAYTIRNYLHDLTNYDAFRERKLSNLCNFRGGWDEQDVVPSWFFNIAHSHALMVRPDSPVIFYRGS